MWDENFKYLVNYYNNDNGIDLPAEPDERQTPYRAVCANIAWCMVNKERFWEYYNKSEYWRVKLMTAAKIYISKYYPMPKSNGKYLDAIRETLDKNIGKKFIMTPCPVESSIDIDTIHVISVDAQGGFL